MITAITIFFLVILMGKYKVSLDESVSFLILVVTGIVDLALFIFIFELVRLLK